MNTTINTDVVINTIALPRPGPTCSAFKWLMSTPREEGCLATRPNHCPPQTPGATHSAHEFSHSGQTRYNVRKFCPSRISETASEPPLKPSDTPNPDLIPSIDPRVAKTRERIIDSFKSLVFERPYEDVSTGDIIDEAGVGKSTFYEHFRSKDELLCQAASGMLATLADAVDASGSAGQIRCLLEHFAQVWGTTRSILRGPASVPFRHTLADLIEARLAMVVDQKRCRLLVPGRLVAMQVAEAQFALFTNWLEQLRPCSSEALAESIVRTSRAMVECQLVASD